MADIESKVLDIIAAKANVDRAAMTRATPMASLPLDSMDFVEILFALEETFDISIPFSANKPEASGGVFETAGDVVDQVTKIVTQSGKATA